MSEQPLHKAVIEEPISAALLLPTITQQVNWSILLMHPMLISIIGNEHAQVYSET